MISCSKSQQTVVNQHDYVTWNKQNWSCLLTKSSLDFAAERLLSSVDSVLVQSFKISRCIKFHTKHRLLPSQEVDKSFFKQLVFFLLYLVLLFGFCLFYVQDVEGKQSKKKQWLNCESQSTFVGHDCFVSCGFSVTAVFLVSGVSVYYLISINLRTNSCGLLSLRLLSPFGKKKKNFPRLQSPFEDTDNRQFINDVMELVPMEPFYFQRSCNYCIIFKYSDLYVKCASQVSVTFQWLRERKML